MLTNQSDPIFSKVLTFNNTALRLNYFKSGTITIDDLKTRININLKRKPTKEEKEDEEEEEEEEKEDKNEGVDRNVKNIKIKIDKTETKFDRNSTIFYSLMNDKLKAFQMANFDKDTPDKQLYKWDGYKLKEEPVDFSVFNRSVNF